MLYLVQKQSKLPKQGEMPEVYIVEGKELNHFLHEQAGPNHVLLFNVFSERNLYIVSNHKD